MRNYRAFANHSFRTRCFGIPEGRPKLSLALCFVGLLIGCGVQPKVSEEKGNHDLPTPPPVPVRTLAASFACLAEAPNPAIDVRWDVALTLAEISSIVYDDPDDQIAKIKKLGATDVKPFSRGTSEGVVASDGKSVVIAFRGTKGFGDILTDIKVFGKRIPGGQMHRGFFNSVEAIYDDAVKAAIQQGAKDKVVWVTGHSLGGAMAAGFTFKSVKEKGIRPTGIITFGQPLVMSESLCQFMLDEFGGDYVRFVNEGDRVSRVLRPYRHAGARVFFKDGDYNLRQPMISVTAPADGPPDAPSSSAAIEIEEDLQLLTDEELAEFEKEIEVAIESKPAAAAAETADGELIVGSWWDPFTNHYMGLYLENLQTIGQTRWK